jgi:membrane protease YdiL (CAAX protease family)
VDDDLWKELLLSSRAYLVIAGAGIALAVAVFFAAPDFLRRPLPLPRLRRGSWTGREVALALLTQTFLVPFLVLSILLVLSSLASLLRDPVPQGQDAPAVDDSARRIILASPVIVTLTLTVVLTILFAISRTRPHQLGVTMARWPANVVLGILAFLTLAPVTLGVYFLAILVFGPEEHPFELLIKQGIAPWEWGFLVFATVVGAPAVEEVVFRGVLKGWLRRASPFGHAVLIATVLAIGAIPLASHQLSAVGGPPPQHDPIKIYAPLVFSCLLAAGYGLWITCIAARPRPARASRPSADIPALRDDAFVEVLLLQDAVRAGLPPPLPIRVALESRAPQQSDWANARLAIYGSAMLFAVAHGWPQSIPLFLLGLGLGWLAYRTQSLIGCMVCHALFNAVACLVLYWGALG